MKLIQRNNVREIKISEKQNFREIINVFKMLKKNMCLYICIEWATSIVRKQELKYFYLL